MTTASPNLVEALTRVALPHWKKEFRASHQAREYMIGQRAISEATLAYFHIGYNPTGRSLVDQMVAMGYEIAPIAGGNETDLMGGCVVFPLLYGDDVVGATGRRIREHAFLPPHMHISSPISIVFNWRATFYRIIYVVESPICAMSLHQIGFPGIAVMGTAAAANRLLSSGVRTDQKVIFVPDYDLNGAGFKGAFKAAVELWRHGYKNMWMVPPETWGAEKDVNGFLTKYGDLTLRRLLQKIELMDVSNNKEIIDEASQLKKQVFKTNTDDGDIVSVASQYGEIKKIGSKYRMLCPFHDESKPSLVIYPESNSFYCYGCARGGGPKQFLKGMVSK
jgi:DNA primase